MTDTERFWSKVEKTDSCWLWKAGGYGGNFDYGQFCLKGRSMSAHRGVWILTNGEIPAGLVVMHVCDNPRCVRPDHLRLGTYAENTADMYAKGREGRSANALKTHCPRGHLLAGENLRASSLKKGKRECRTCNVNADRRYRNARWLSSSSPTTGKSE